MSNLKEKTLKPQKELNSLALGLSKDSNGHWNLVEVKYNLETKESEVVESTNYGNDTDMARERFRIKVATELF